MAPVIQVGEFGVLDLGGGRYAVPSWARDGNIYLRPDSRSGLSPVTEPVWTGGVSEFTGEKIFQPGQVSQEIDGNWYHIYSGNPTGIWNEHEDKPSITNRHVLGGLAIFAAGAGAIAYAGAGSIAANASLGAAEAGSVTGANTVAGIGASSALSTAMNGVKAVGTVAGVAATLKGLSSGPQKPEQSQMTNSPQKVVQQISTPPEHDREVIPQAVKKTDIIALAKAHPVESLAIIIVAITAIYFVVNYGKK